MALEWSVSRLNPIISEWAFKINIRTMIHPSFSEQSQISKETSHKCISLCVHKEILSKRNLKACYTFSLMRYRKKLK